MKHDHEKLLKDSNPLDHRDLETTNLAEAEESLKQGILATPRSTGDDDRADAPRRGGLASLLPRHRLIPVTAVAGALAALFLAIALVNTGGGPDSGGANQAWAAEIIKMANGSPRLILDKEGWEISRADQFSAQDGDMSFTNGGLEVELGWMEARLHRSYVNDRASNARLVARHPVPGGTATVFLYDGTENSFTALWHNGPHSLELRVFPKEDESVSEADFLDLLDSLRRVDAETWLAALPESVVKPSQAFVAATEMMADIPAPPGFDLANTVDPNLARDRYQLGAKVAGAAACGWIGQWVEATNAGDRRKADQAVDVMQGTRDWKILHEMDVEGDYPEVVWSFADAMAGGGKIEMGTTLWVKDTYREALGC